MAGQRRTVLPTVGATGSGGRVTSSTRRTVNEVSNDRRLLPGKSGFTSNQRPVLGYQPSLDLIDNPRFGLLLSDNFISQTKRDYQPYTDCDGSGSLPNVSNKSRESGFFQLNSSPKAPRQQERTEYQRLFVSHPLVPTVPPHKVVSVGQKEESGFTEGADLQINTFIDKTSPLIENRYTPDSVTKNDFKAPFHLQGTEVIPSLRSYSCRETGYSRGATARLTIPSSLLPSPCKPTAASLLKTSGKKEPSGFLHNAPNHRTYPLTRLHSSHFTTHYENAYCSNAGLRNRWSNTGAGIIHSKMDNSYSRREMDRFIFRDSTFT